MLDPLSVSGALRRWDTHRAQRPSRRRGSGVKFARVLGTEVPRTLGRSGNSGRQDSRGVRPGRGEESAGPSRPA